MFPFLSLALWALGGSGPAPEIPPPRLTGYYHSFQPEKGEVSGIVHVTEHESRYLVAWFGKPKITEDGKFAFATLHGVGTLKKGVFAVACSGPAPSVGVYEIKKAKKGYVLEADDDHWFPIEDPKIVAEAILGAMVCASEPEVIDWKLKKAQGQTYPHLPTEQECATNHKLTQQRRADAVHMALTIGYLSQVNDPELWDGNRLVWCGGGWHAEGIKAEIAECDRLESIWWACWWVQWAPASVETRETWAATLRGLIGADAYWSGTLPVPYPPRRQPSFRPYWHTAGAWE